MEPEILLLKQSPKGCRYCCSVDHTLSSEVDHTLSSEAELHLSISLTWREACEVCLGGLFPTPFLEECLTWTSLGPEGKLLSY